MSIITPKLRNSSIIGKRFTNPIDPSVEENLKELNEILGKTSFSKIEHQRQEDVGVLTRKMKEITIDAIKKKEEAEKARKEADIALENLNKFKSSKAPGSEDASSGTSTNGNQKELLQSIATEKKALARAKTKEYEEAQQLKAEHSDLLLAAVFGTAISEHNLHHHPSPSFNLEIELKKPLLAKKTASDRWDNNGILNFIIENEEKGKISISECIDQENALSNLKNEFENLLNINWNSLSNNQKAIFKPEFRNVLDYLVAYAYWVKGISEVNALYNFITTHKNGAKAVYNYLVISSVRAFIQKKSLKIPKIDGNTYNEDAHPLIKKIESMQPELDEDTFTDVISKAINTSIDSGKDIGLINEGLKQLKIDDLPSGYIPLLVHYLRKSSVSIDKDNIGYFLPIFISDIKGKEYEPEPVYEELDVEQSDKDFEVDFSDDLVNNIRTNASNVKCAAQLFSSSILEMDLDLFNLTNYLTNNYLLRNRIDIEDQRLRQNLQTFVFSNKFIDPKTGQLTERTREGERKHFYRQVLNVGNDPLPQGISGNSVFEKRFRKLIPAVKDYLENSSASLQSDTFVSKGGVMQLCATINTNLSDRCTGMAKIISPLIDAEWHFIKDKILGHPEIVKQISPTVGTWKGVAQTLYQSMKKTHTDASLIYQKANICYKILNAIATYDPPVFEQDNNFLDFCSMVIELDELLQSITNEDGSEDYGIDDDPEQLPQAEQKPEMPKTMPSGDDEWDF